ncbi:MAG: M4 family metallopeptidase [Geothrix sp.]|nr:M4 family metallopeptidase [Geothrix sp.]
MHRIIRLSLVAGLALGPLAARENPLHQQAARSLSARTFQLGLDRDHGFAPGRIHQDNLLNESDVRMNQLYRGVKVFGGEAIVHLSGGATRTITDGLVKGLKLNTTPVLTSSEALATVHQALNPTGPYAYAPTAELVVAPVEAGNSAFHALVWHIHTELENGAAETAHTDFFVDAKTGAILERWSTLQTSGVTGTGLSQYSGTVSLDTNSLVTGFELRDMTRGVGGTYGQTVVTNMNHSTTVNGNIYTDADNTWGDGLNYVETTDTTLANGQTAAVDAAYGMQKTWDMYKNVLARNGIDNLGTATFSRVHYSSAYDNAFWSTTCFCMTYGDGTLFTTLTSMDVAAHEMSHGVMAYSANLTYKFESGGLNEANSDIMGAAAEFYVRGAGTTAIPNYTAITGTISTVGGLVPAANYLIGEQLETASFNHPLRWMYKPSLDGRSPDFWSSTLRRLDVHYSSGPANHWYFLVAHGSQVDTFSGNIASPMANGVTSITGIGNQAATAIWYRAVTKYMTSSTIYAGARTATLTAATDLYGAASPEYAAVALAWTAVNVL